MNFYSEIRIIKIRTKSSWNTYSEVRSFSDLEKFTTDLREVFGFLQNDGNKQQLEKYVHEYRETLINLEEDAYDLICVMSDMRKLQELKAELRQEGGCNMCKGLEEMMEDEKKKGIEQAEYLL